MGNIDKSISKRLKNIPNISFKSSEDTKDIEILELSDLFERMPNMHDHNPRKPHRVSFFALLIVTNGTGTHNIDLIEYELKPGTVLKVAKGQVHAFQNDPKYKGFLIIFTEDFVLNYFSKSAINLISHLYNYHISSPITEDLKLNESFLKELRRELVHENTYANKNIVAALLELYLLRLERDSQHQEAKTINQRHYTLFVQFKNLMEAESTTTRNVTDYAEMMFISAKLLNQIVKEFTLNTAKTFIDNYIVLEAKRAIVSSEKSLKEIAFDAGFDEATNFTKFFKRHMGISPKEFRNQQI